MHTMAAFLMQFPFPSFSPSILTPTAIAPADELRHFIIQTLNIGCYMAPCPGYRSKRIRPVNCRQRTQRHHVTTETPINQSESLVHASQLRLKVVHRLNWFSWKGPGREKSK